MDIINNNATNNTPTIISNGISVSPILISGNDYYYSFTSTSGTNTILFPSNTICDALIIGGGGAGG